MNAAPSTRKPAPRPQWGLASLALPCLAVLTSRVWGGGLDAVVPLTGICLVGLAIAAAGMVRGERPLWFALLGILANCVVILPLLIYLPVAVAAFLSKTR